MGRTLTAVGSPTSVASPFGTIPNRPADSSENVLSAGISAASPYSYYTAPDLPTHYLALTVEAYARLNSVATDGAARTIASQLGAASPANRSFTFGVAGNGSSAFEDDRTLFLQVWNTSGAARNIDSGFRLTLATDYYLAFSAAPGSLNGGADGSITFYVKNLSTPDAPLLTSTRTVTGFSGFFNSTALFGVGSAVGGNNGSPWHGLLDEVRFSDTVLSESELLVSVPEPGSAALLTLGALLMGGRRRRTQR